MVRPCRRSLLVRLATLTAWLATGLALGAQAPSPQRPVFQGGVDLVQIDVVALDKDGHPVTGLTAADFTLLDRKKPQKIETFEEVTRPQTSEATTLAVAPPASPTKLDVATNQIPATDRLVVMVLDDLHVFRGRTDRVKTIAKEVLDALGPGSSISVLFTSGRQSVEFTRDKGELLAAIDTFVGQQAARRPNPGTESAPLSSKSFDDSVPRPGARPLAAAPVFGGSPDTGVLLQKFFDDQTLHRTMEDAARLLIGARGGRKAFVMISEGTANNLDQMFKSRLTPCEIKWPVSPCYYQRALLLAVEAMQRANVSLYAFDARGYVSNDDILLECTPTSGASNDPCVGRTIADPHNWIRNDQHGFEITAEATGGFAVTNSDDFSGGVARMVAEIDHYYLLGFVPTDPKGSGFRPVDVAVNRPGVTLHFRQGYTVTSAEDAAGNKTSADPAVAMSQGILPKTDLSLRLMAEPVAPAVGPNVAKDALLMAAILEVAIPRAEIRQADGSLAGDLRYTLIAGSLANGRAAAELTNTATLSSTGAGSSTDPVTVEIPILIPLAPGRYQLRASALLPATSRGGSVYLDVAVPDDRDAPLVLGGPFIAVSGVAAPPMATRAAGLTWPFTPSLDRRFRPGDQLAVFCPILRQSAPVRATIEVRDAAGQVEITSDAEGTDPQVISGGISLLGLPPGGYTLRVHATDGPHVADRQIGFAVVDK